MLILAIDLWLNHALVDLGSRRNCQMNTHCCKVEGYT